MKKMYPPVVNSPKTELTEVITESQTDIAVMDASVLLQGEGIAVIGNGDAAETITYTLIDGNTLKGCTRGFEGAARAWSAGTRIARNFTAYDLEATQDNITEVATDFEAHASRHLPGGEDPIPFATALLGGLMNPADKIAVDQIGASNFFNIEAQSGETAAEKIQAAFDAAEEAGGGIVFGPAGTYLMDAIVYIPSNVTFISTPQTIYKRNANINGMFLNKSDGTVGGYEANQNIKVIGGVFDGNKDVFTTECTQMAFGHCTNVEVIGAKFVNTCIWHALEFNAVNHGKVIKCIFDGYTPGGSEQLQIDLADAGPFPWFGPYDQTMCKHILISECEFVNGTDGIGSHTAIVGKYHTDITIEKCSFYNFSGVAIKPLNYRSLTISNNYIEDVHRGIVISNADTDTTEDVKILNNTVINANKNDQSRAIMVSRGVNKGVLTGNYVRKIGRHGIGVDFGNDWVIQDNQIYECAANGMWVYATNNAIVTGNIVKQNAGQDIITGASGIDRNSNNIIANNVLEKMSIQFTDNSMVTNNIITVGYGSNDSASTSRINNIIAGVFTPN